MNRLLALLLMCALAGPGASVAVASDPGVAGIVVIVHPQSGVEKLTREEVVDIFLGRYRKLPGGRVALPIDLAETNPERARFYQLLVKKSLAEMSSYWARLVFSGQTAPPFQVSDAPAALELVRSSPNAIAYVDRTAVTGDVKVVLELQP